MEGEAESSLRKIFLEATTNSPSCILLDDFDLLCPQRSSSNASELQKRLVTCFLSLVDELNANTTAQVLLLACTTKPLDIDEAAKRAGRIDVEFELVNPAEDDRKEILTFLLSQNKNNTNTNDNRLHILEDEDSLDILRQKEENPEDPGSVYYYIFRKTIHETAKLAHGMVGADLLQLIKESFYYCCLRNNNNKSDELSKHLENLTIDERKEEKEKVGIQRRAFIELSFDNMSNALKKVSPSSLREVTVEVPTVRWTDIGGMESVKQSLRQVIELPLKHPELFKNSGLTPLKGILLYGPPGCSKTLMAKAVATETSMNFLAGKKLFTILHCFC
jgi:SpoVK/Ycf46/Vps4 family AAA+-type ATPase